MNLCPQDFKPCLDDLCHGAGCCFQTGEPMMERCAMCGELHERQWSRYCEDCAIELRDEQEENGN